MLDCAAKRKSHSEVLEVRTQHKNLGYTIQPVIGSKTYRQVSVVQGSKDLSQGSEASHSPGLEEGGAPPSGGRGKFPESRTIELNWSI